MISIIVPVYNEEKMLVRNIDYYQDLAQKTELIFVDGGSHDRTAALARGLGHVIRTDKNRAAQMNAGAQAAKGDILLFVHADAVIQSGALDAIRRTFEESDVIGGCLTQVLDDPGLIFKWIALTGNVRARATKVFFGDQGLFVLKDVFDRLGGFPDVTICEDILFSKLLRRQGKTTVLPSRILCSARRWKQQGVLRTFYINARLKAALTCGRDLKTLETLYRDVRG